MRVMKNNDDTDDGATAWLTTQLLFSYALNQSICTGEPLYHDKGQPDPTLASDNVIGQEADPSAHVCDVRNIEGVILASKKTGHSLQPG